MEFFQELARALNVDPHSDSTKLAVEQLDNDERMLEELIELRQEQFDSVEEFAQKVGMDVDSILAFEDDPVDFSLDFVRLYSLGIGAEVVHHVISAAERIADSNFEREWVMMKRQANVTKLPTSNRRRRVEDIAAWRNTRPIGNGSSLKAAL